MTRHSRPISRRTGGPETPLHKRHRLKRPSERGAPEYYTRDQKPAVASPGPEDIGDPEAEAEDDA